MTEYNYPLKPAQYAGTCWKCGRPIEVGQTIAFLRERWGHHRCGPAAPSPEPRYCMRECSETKFGGVAIYSPQCPHCGSPTCTMQELEEGIE